MIATTLPPHLPDRIIHRKTRKAPSGDDSKQGKYMKRGEVANLLRSILWFEWVGNDDDEKQEGPK